MELFKIEILHDRQIVRLTIVQTGEIREAEKLETIFKSLVSDYGFYLRRKPVK